MTRILTALSGAALAGVIGFSFDAPASATAYDPAAAYVEQFSGIGMHKAVSGEAVEASDPADDYIESFGWMKMAAARHANQMNVQDDRTKADIEGLR